MNTLINWTYNAEILIECKQGALQGNRWWYGRYGHRHITF